MRRILFISLIFIMLSAEKARADVMIIIRRQAEAAGNYVRICDVARLEGPKEQLLEVAGIILGPTPVRGETREFTRWDIETRLAEMGIAANVAFTGNDKVRVLGDGVRRPAPGDAEAPRLAGLTDFPASRPLASAPAPAALGEDWGGRPAAPAPARPETALDGMAAESRERLTKIINAYLAGQYSRPDVEVSARLLSLSAPIPLAAGEIRVEEASGKIPGPASLRLSVREAPDSPPRQVLAAADAEVSALAPVAARPLFKGETLSARDVKVARVRMDPGKTYLPPLAEAAAGLELSRNFSSGEAILAADTVRSPEVRRGDLVQCVTSFNSRNSVWTVSGNGRALGGGATGEVITVEDLTSKAKYQARITGRGMVSVLPKGK